MLPEFASGDQDCPACRHRHEKKAIAKRSKPPMNPHGSSFEKPQASNRDQRLYCETLPSLLNTYLPKRIRSPVVTSGAQLVGLGHFVLTDCDCLCCSKV